MPTFGDQRVLATAVWRTWGARGLARRASYEVQRRAGVTRRAEERALRSAVRPAVLARAGVVPPRSLVDPGPIAWGAEAEIVLYGGLSVASGVPPRWHRQPLEGHEHPGTAHWSELSDSAVDHGDIKDVWELSRLGWLQQHVRHAMATGDDRAAEEVWLAVEDWQRRNPPYQGPNWMCAQETSLRTISVIFLAEALDASPTTSPARRLLVATMVQDAVGRVAPTLGYALSQRNNHASSEAGFLWTAAVLAPWLPGADRLRRRAARALTEIVRDQFREDGSYAQHSPTYQRVALHVLLWCLAISRATGEAPPPGVTDAVARSVPHLRALAAPGGEGRLPNLGGNDGALVFDLAPTGRGDFRPLLVHAAAATGQAIDIEPGVWDEEAAWFGLTPRRSDGADEREDRRPEATGAAWTGATHALTRGSAHAVLRAGPLRHRPAHADQLHVDVWLGGRPVAVDPGSYRYTAPAPWGNALAGDDVHNVPRRASSPQARRSGRFFWREWSTATVVSRSLETDVAACVARLQLPDGTVLDRGLAVGSDVVLVIDRVTGGSAEVRWNLPHGTAMASSVGGCVATGPSSWSARFAHPGGRRVLDPVAGEPASGWAAPSYGSLESLTPLLIDLVPGRPSVSVFAEGRARDLLEHLVAVAEGTVEMEATALARLLHGVLPSGQGDAAP